jgi:hypothetical protein
MNREKKPSTEIKIWHPQQELLLQEWAEISSGYRWLHDNAYRKYKRQSLAFTIPVIIMSTVTGTANFAQTSFPVSVQHIVPMFIGMLNLVAAIITTICQFLKTNELMEGNRVASINFGKLNRNITVELNLPHQERTNMGAEFLRTCQGEFDRLVEQAPVIPREVLKMYSKTFDGENFSKPEINHINKVRVFQDKNARTSVILADAASIFKSKQKSSQIQRQKDRIESEIQMQKTFERSSDIETPPPLPDKSENSFIKDVVDDVIEDAIGDIQEEADQQPRDVKAIASLFSKKS